MENRQRTGGRVEMVKDTGGTCDGESFHGRTPPKQLNEVQQAEKIASQKYDKYTVITSEMD